MHHLGADLSSVPGELVLDPGVGRSARAQSGWRISVGRARALEPFQHARDRPGLLRAAPRHVREDTRPLIGPVVRLQRVEATLARRR